MAIVVLLHDLIVAQPFQCALLFILRPIWPAQRPGGQCRLHQGQHIVGWSLCVFCPCLVRLPQLQQAAGVIAQIIRDVWRLAQGGGIVPFCDGQLAVPVCQQTQQGVGGGIVAIGAQYLVQGILHGLAIVAMQPQATRLNKAEVGIVGVCVAQWRQLAF